MSLQLGTLFACFFFSGFAALLYQTAWTRELSFVFGTSETAVVAVLAAYMGGLAFGSAVAAKYADRVTRPVLTYGLLEGGIAACGLMIPLALSGLNFLYILLFGGQSDWPASRPLALDLFQLASAFLVLLPPTALMGATLPLLARHAVRQDSEIASRVGALYVFNTAGAILGTLLTAFWLMPEFGLRHTVWIGAGTNALVCGLAIAVARRAIAEAARTEPAFAEADERAPEADDPRASWILPAIALSGSLSFTLEVVWTRLLGHLVGGSLQAFASMLACFLLGITLGAAAASRLASTRTRAVFGFALSLLGLAFFAALSLWGSDVLVDIAQRVDAGPDAAIGNLLVAGAALLPTTICIGATFPFAIRIYTQSARDTARSTAQVYLWNTCGSIVGALGGGYLVLPSLGYANTVKLIVALASALAVAALAQRARSRPGAWRMTGATALAAGIAFLAIPIPEPNRLLGSSPLNSLNLADTVVFSSVGRSASVLVADRGPHFRLAGNGLPESAVRKAGELPSAGAEHWLGFLPSLLRASTREILVVGLGGGSALEFVSPSVERIDVIELEPEILSANRFIGSDRAIDPLSDPRVRVHIGDARGSLRLIEKRYDAIVSQPSHPWTAGASHLYTREFFELVRSRLNPDGVFVQWIGVSFLDEELLRSLVATVQDTFRYVEAYRPDPRSLIFVGSMQPFDSLASIEQTLTDGASTYRWFGLDSIEDLARTLVLSPEGAMHFAHAAPLNTDDHNRLSTAVSRRGDSLLTAVAVERVLLANNPLVEIGGIDRPALVWQLASERRLRRAEQIVEAIATEPERETARANLELARGDRAAAIARFEKALLTAPADFDLLAGLIAARRAEWITDLDAPLPAGAEMHPSLVALVAAWRGASVNDWEAVHRSDALLAEFEPNDLLWEEATRLRIRSRLEHDATSGQQADAREAQHLAERLVLRHWTPQDELLRAQAAVGAGDFDVSFSAFRAALVRTREPGERKNVVQKIRDLARRLPAEQRNQVDRLLASKGFRSERNGGARR